MIFIYRAVKHFWLYEAREEASSKIIERSDRIMKNNQMFSQWIQRFFSQIINVSAGELKKYNEQRKVT